MLDSYARHTVQPAIEKGAKMLRSARISANTITLIAMLMGVGSAVIFSLGFPVAAVVMLYDIRFSRCCGWHTCQNDQAF